MFKFIKSRTFFIHLGIYTLTLALMCWLVISWLGSYTSHGKTIKVPSFSGVKLADLNKFVSDKNVRYLVIDSIYDTKSPKGTVIKQEPELGSEVKEGRIIYLYVTSVLPPSIQMPKLIDRSLRQAIAMIVTYGFKLGTVKFVPDQCANCVLDQMVKGKKIEPGTGIAKGTVINLVVGQGLSDEEVGVPCLSGLSSSEAAGKLAEASLSVGLVSYDEPKDSASSKVYRQSPSCGKQTVIKMGRSVDLFLTADKNKIPQKADSSSVTQKTKDENFDN